jgi:DNA-binding LytR/AlgR family response regulator
MVDHIKKIPALELKCATTDPIEALTFLDAETVDCIYLDVEMPQLSGIEFMEALKAKFGHNMPKIILITAYDQYALTGYDYGVFDYILKPISFKRFKISVDRLLATFNHVEENRDFLFVDVDGKKLKINFTDIVYVEGAGNYIFIATAEKKIICYKTLTHLLELLPQNNFVRVHKSFIVSLSGIEAMRGNEVFVTLKNASKNIPIGTTYKDNLLRILKIID